MLLVVDQLTPELLTRYDRAFEGGFRRLLDEGRAFDAVHDHAVSYTSPGHAALTTGVSPARHGIVSNSWREWKGGSWVTVSSVADEETELVGGTGTGSSPRNLLADGLPDWLVARSPESRVISISGKNTSAVLMAGRRPGAARGEEGPGGGHVYWFSSGSEAFVTSTWYRAAIPDWVTELNRGLVERFVEPDCWESDLSPEIARLSRQDTVAWERDHVHTHFPHCRSTGAYRNTGHFISRTPALDRATLGLAREAVTALELGSCEAADYLAISLSSSDRVGHDFGPYSREQLDNLVRLDREVGAFLDFLDESVGPGRYLVVLSSDHGVLPLPEHLVEEGLPGGRMGAELGEAFEEASVGLGPTGAELEDDGAAERRRELARRLERFAWVEAAMPLELLGSDSPADSFVTLYRRSFHPDRLSTRMARRGVEVRPPEGSLTIPTGTTHGVPYAHDRQVPLLFYGPGIRAGAAEGAARTVDVPPTLAGLLGIPVPEGLDGRALELR